MNIIFRFRTSKNISRNKIYPKKTVWNSASVLPIQILFLSVTNTVFLTVSVTKLFLSYTKPPTLTQFKTHVEGEHLNSFLKSFFSLAVQL